MAVIRAEYLKLGKMRWDASVVKFRSIYAAAAADDDDDDENDKRAF